MTKSRAIIFTDKAGNTHEFKTPKGPRITSIIFAKYPPEISIGAALADGKQAMIITANLDADRIAANHKAHYTAKDLEIITEWKEI